MFGFGFRPFDEDPFFRAHHERMRDSFGGFNTFGMLSDRDPFAFEGHPPHDRRRTREVQQRDHGGHLAHRDMFGVGPMFGPSMFHNIEQQFARAVNDPNNFSYTQSSVMSYSKDGRGEPKYFQAHHSSKNAPGGIKETRKAVRDSESGLQKMAVGHHIGDKAHFIERSVNRKTGHKEQKQDFVNLNEENADEFNQEWSTRTRSLANQRKPVRERPEHRRERPERVCDHDYERKLRLKSRPINRHAPRGGLD